MKKYIYIVIFLFIRYEIEAQSVYTPKGVQVPQNAIGTYEENIYDGTTNGQLQNFQNAVSNGLYGSSCVVMGSYSRQYNCHGYAWHVSYGVGQTAIFQYMWNGYFLENTYAIEAYVAGNNPSYSQTSYNNQSGLIVRYSGDHSAITTNEPGMYISKWGAGPLVKHSANDVPNGSNGSADYGSPATYWTCDYTVPLHNIYLDGNPIGTSYQFPVSNGNHNLGISYGLTPNGGIKFLSYNANISINSQNGNSVNFNKYGTGQLAVRMCGQNGFNFVLFQAYQGMSVYPNPAQEEMTVELKTSDLDSEIVPVFLGDKDLSVSIVEMKLLDENNNVLKNYDMNNENGKKSTIKFERNLKGNYFLKAIMSDGTSQVKRISISQ